jgi:hypothetical protein
VTEPIPEAEAFIQFKVNPTSQIKSLFPVVKNPANQHRAVGFTTEQFHYAFANTVSREESDAAYDLLHIPAPGDWVWAYGLIANFSRWPTTRASARRATRERRTADQPQTSGRVAHPASRAREIG